MDQPAIELRSVSKTYPGGARAADGVTLAAPPGALLALLGPSGCGKSTLLRLVAGLEAPDAGEVLLGGRRVAGAGVFVPPEARRVGLVFQDGALFPHMTAAENIAFSLERHTRPERRRRVAELLETVGLGALGERYPHQLSGGQQQRVALARALAASPPVVLLDEPFSNLDATLRKSLRAEVEEIVRASGATTVFVTHDQEEALSIADLVAVMFEGRIAQIGSPQEVYARPATRQAAAFVGEGNFLAGQADGAWATCALGRVPLAAPASGPVELMVRPESLDVEPDAGAGTSGQGEGGAGAIERAVFFGYDQMLLIRLDDGTQVQARCRPHDELRAGARVRVRARGVAVAYPAAGRGGDGVGQIEQVGSAAEGATTGPHTARRRTER